MKSLIGYFTQSDVKFSDPASGFKIARFHTENDIVSIKGIFPDIPEGFIELSVRNEERNKYGVTYNIDSYKPHMPIKKDSIIRYLENFLELSTNQATKIYEYYRELNLDTFEGLDNHPDEIDNIKALFKSADRKEAFLQKKSQEKTLRQVRFFLYDYGFSELQSQKIIKVWAENSLEVIQQLPYNLLIIEGVSFKQVDRLYFDLGGKRDDEVRIMSAMLYFLNQHCQKTKDSYIEYGEYKNLINKELNLYLDDEVLSKLINKLACKNKSERPKGSMFTDSLTALNLWEKGFVIYLESLYYMETYIAKKISEFLAFKQKEVFALEDTSIEDKEMNEDQKQAVENCYNYNVSIIRGYGGTGKSTIIKKIIDIAKKKNMSYTLLAPTGKAVDVLIKASDSPENCSTIHRKLLLKTEWKRSEIELTEDIILVDESSMKSLPLAYSLLSSFMAHPYRRLVIVWDDNQLLPIWIGSFLLSCIRSQKIPEVRLTKIYRQKEDSLILENSKRIVEDQELDMRTTHDWVFIDTSFQSETQIAERLLKEIQKAGWNNDTDVVIGAQYKGEAGITAINNKIQMYYQADNTYFYERGIYKFFLGDRVMHVNTNLYSKSTEKRALWLPSFLLVDKEHIKKLDTIFSLFWTLPSSWFYYNPRNGYIMKSNIEAIDFVVEEELEKNEKKNGKEETIKENTENSYVKKLAKIGNNTIEILSWESGNIRDLEDKNIYNGNWGMIEALKTETGWFGYDENRKVKKLEIDIPLVKDDEYVALVNFWDKYFFYKRKELSMLSLFYGSTVHKMQWSQFQKVYGILNPKDSNSYYSMVDKKWLYTMISRAQEKMIYFSSRELTRQVQKISGDNRKSLLEQFIKHYSKKRKEQETEAQK